MDNTREMELTSRKAMTWWFNSEYPIQHFMKINEACRRSYTDEHPNPDDLAIRNAILKYYDDDYGKKKDYRRMTVEDCRPTEIKSKIPKEQQEVEKENEEMLTRVLTAALAVKEGENKITKPAHPVKAKDKWRVIKENNEKMAGKSSENVGNDVRSALHSVGEHGIIEEKTDGGGVDMGAKVICPKCKTSFELSVLKQMDSLDFCPVCKTSFDGEDADVSEAVKTPVDEDKGILNSADENMEVVRIGEASSNCEAILHIRCKKCGDQKGRGRSRFEEVTDRYVRLKPDEDVVCDTCGYKSRKVISVNIPKPVENAYSNVPHCPHCGAISIEKISGSSKLVKAALIGVFAIPEVGKQFKCQVCGYKW